MTYRSNSLKVPGLDAVRSIESLSGLLKIKADKILYSIRNAHRMYKSISIPKKDGTPRPIRAPREDLKEIQRAVLDTILAPRHLPAYVYGFTAGKSIVENAQLHSQSKYLLTLDIKNFFPSVHESRVNRVFAEFGATASIADALTKLATLDCSLPQGAPTSPHLAALALRGIDARISKLCSKNGLIYSRYFDDITVSGKNARAHEILPTIIRIIESSGYKVHKRPDKLRMYSPGETRIVTGIEIKDGTLSVPNVAETTDYIKCLSARGMKCLKSDNPLKESLSLRGKIAFITQVSPELGKALGVEFEKIDWMI